MFVDGIEVDLSSHALRSKLIAPQVPMPRRTAGDMVSITVFCQTSVSQFDGSACGFWGRPALLAPSPIGDVQGSYDGTHAVIRCGGNEWRVSHSLMKDDNNE